LFSPDNSSESDHPREDPTNNPEPNQSSGNISGSECALEYLVTKNIENAFSTWINSNVWPPSCWSVYKEAVRTNNDVEGWHNSLNRRASGRCQMPFYLLINLLYREARLANLHIRLVSEMKLKRFQRKKYRNVQAKIFSYWEEYENGQRSSLRLLKACSHVNGPVSK
jgi:hypothetical protein